IGVWGAVIGASTAAGPIVGGLLVQHIGWEACFYVNVPVGAAALIMSLVVLKETPAAPAGSFDIPGIAALSGALFALIFGLIKAPDYGWVSARTLAFLLAAALLGLLFGLSRLGATASPNETIIWFVLLGLGLAPVMVGATNVIVGNAPAELAGVAGGLQSTAMQLGGAFGTAVLGAIMSAKIDSLLPAS